MNIKDRYLDFVTYSIKADQENIHHLCINHFVLDHLVLGLVDQTRLGDVSPHQV